MINFPVFERVCVRNYALYAGTSDSPGLDHTFQPGVNVIVGINGLGKTTLLNILLRSLTGAVDIPGDDQLGDKKRRLVAECPCRHRERDRHMPKRSATPLHRLGSVPIRDS